MSLEDITSLELRSRETHTSAQGIRTDCKYHVEPYSAFPDLVRLLEGEVYQDENEQWQRRLPIYDQFFPDYCYCNETRVDAIDWRGVSYSPTLGYVPEDRDDEDELRLKMRDALQIRDTNLAGGAFVTATHMPLHTAWPNPDESEAFDFVDPTYNLTFKTIPWPDALQVAVDKFGIGVPLPGGLSGCPVPVGIADPIALPVIEFSIRRLLVGTPRWDVMEAAAGSVNKEIWPGNNFPNMKIPRFPANTLKFDGGEVLNRCSSCSTEHRHYEIILHFSWLNYFDAPVYDDHGVSGGDMEPVTWQHVLMRPEDKYILFWGKKFGCGWYWASRMESIYPAQLLRSGLLMKHLGPLYSQVKFDNLFRLNPVQE